MVVPTPRFMACFASRHLLLWPLLAVNNKIINEEIEEYSRAARGHRTPEVASAVMK